MRTTLSQKKRINKPKTSIKPKLQRHKTNIKLVTEPAFLPNTCYRQDV